MRVGFLGLGIMGHAMATNLVKAGHEVTVWNRTPGKLVEGAGIAPTPAAAAQGAEVIWLCVSDTAAVEQILFGADGIDQSLADGMMIADSSTISPSATVRFAERVRTKGVAYVDAPMTGSKIGAANGTLIFMVGGDAANIDRLNPLFAAMGKKIFRMGETGKGQATKLAMNLQIAGQTDLAEQLYAAILKAEPTHAAANHCLGMLHVQLRRPANGLPYLRTALNERPELPDYWLGYLEALLQAGETEEAAETLALARGHGLSGAAVDEFSRRLTARGPQAAAVHPRHGWSRSCGRRPTLAGAPPLRAPRTTRSLTALIGHVAESRSPG